MQATSILMHEHRIIERVLDALQTVANRLKGGEVVNPRFFIDAADFAKGFTDGCHHKKEEGVLFPAMEAAGIPAEGGPIAVMLSEHEEGRRLIASMRAGAERLQGGDESARAPVVESALAYVALLRQHISKEDNILFPMADQVLRGAAAVEVEKAFDRIETEETGEGVHDRFLALAESLGHEASH
jgi:hemerythrin-like domain-containing protein